MITVIPGQILDRITILQQFRCAMFADFEEDTVWSMTQITIFFLVILQLPCDVVNNLRDSGGKIKMTSFLQPYLSHVHNSSNCINSSGPSIILFGGLK